MKITEDIKYIGVTDKIIDLFEGQYNVPDGMTYNSYVILDEKVAVMDTVDAKFTDEWLANLAEALGGRKPDYLIVQHMEPDHSANIANFMSTYPETVVVANAKTFSMIANYFEIDLENRKLCVENGGTLSLGHHELSFVFAPMVHWPEVMLTYDATDKILFSADAFGVFGNPDPSCWDDEARRYYIGIVGKYGMQVQALLKKAAALEISVICPLHGPVLKENLSHYIGLYDTWSSYRPEKEGVLIAFTSVYGHTKAAAVMLESLLKDAGCETRLIDLAREDMSLAVAEAFKYSKLVLATTTYNNELFPFMKQFIDHLTERSFQNRTVGFIENGSWAPTAAKTMRAMLENSKNLTFTDTVCTVKSALKPESAEQIKALAKELI